MLPYLFAAIPVNGANRQKTAVIAQDVQIGLSIAGWHPNFSG